MIGAVSRTEPQRYNNLGNDNHQHTVTAGDTLSKIARDNDVSLDALLAANPQITNPNAISVGQVINLPVQSATTDSATSTPSPVYTGAGSSPGTGGLSNSQYSVVAGDTFSRIAHDNNVTLALLIAANPQISNVNSISIGQLINIPASTSTSAARNNDPVSSPIYTGPGSSPGTGGLPPTTPPEYTGPGSSPDTGGLPPTTPPEYTGPGSSPGTGGLPPAIRRADELRQTLPVSQPVDAADLLATGNYDNHFTRGTDLDLAQAEQSANEFNGDDNHIVIQSVFDPVVSGKNTTIDEYSVTAVLPEGVDPRELLKRMAADMDQTLGGEFQDLGDFKNQGTAPEVGQIIDIDVKDGPRIPFTESKIPGSESPFNAPVIISHMDDNSFSVQTIEYNNQEHLLHGTREWGFEENANGSVTFYTRGVSVEDIQAAEGIPLLGNAKEGEFRFWSAWTDGVIRELEADGAGIINRETIQTTDGPTGQELWQDLDRDQRTLIKETQIASHEREVERLEDDIDNLSFWDEFFRGEQVPLWNLAYEHQREVDGWNQVDV